jgi:hypothetical protein
MGEHEHLIVEEVSPDGEPLLPKKNTNEFVTQCRVLVRDNILISIQEWNKSKVVGVSFVNDRAKNTLW